MRGLGNRGNHPNYGLVGLAHRTSQLRSCGCGMPHIRVKEIAAVKHAASHKRQELTTGHPER